MTRTSTYDTYLASVECAETEAYLVQWQQDTNDKRRAADYGHGDWTTPRMQRLPIWHLFAGMHLQAKYDNRIAALGGDCTVVGNAQLDGKYHGLMHLLVRCDATGQTHTLSGYSNAAYFATVAPVDHSHEAFYVNSFHSNIHRARVA